MIEYWGPLLVVFLAILPIVALAGGIAIAVVAIRQQTKLQEMRHRERLAMIERGLMPPPERDPAAFHAMDRHHGPPARFVSFGVAVVAVGLGVMLIIGLAGGAPGPAVGVGGAIVLLGAAFIINGMLQRGRRPIAASPERVPGSPPKLPAGPTDPPGPVGP